jgi:glucosamine--fructose-6-phosphate aminotransferase (isomerizing)
MCGIVGYIGREDAKEVILNGLKRLEYRGYDSAGLSLFNIKNQRFDIYKSVGRVSILDEKVQTVLKSPVGIGHTRWATHGKVNNENAHPHHSRTGRFIIVHNGVIENYQKLKDQYLSDHIFYSETDTEVIAQLIESFASHFDIKNAILTTLKLLQGSYALLVIDSHNPEVIYAAKNKSPLIIGKDTNGSVVASDLMGLFGFAKNYYPLEDKTFVVLEQDKISIYNLDHELQKINFKKMTLDESIVDKGTYEHFMLKEINEQPSVIRRIVQNYFVDNTIKISEQIKRFIKQSDRIYMLACGTSMHAALVGKQLFEELSEKPVDVHIASEFAYNNTIISSKPLFILISQSGETADLRACLVKLKSKGYTTLTLTNVITSTLAREANYALELFAGPEIAVASTKAYVAQVALLAILANITNQTIDLRTEFTKVAQSIESFLIDERIREIVRQKLTKQKCFYIGRGMDYSVTLEAALKLKEISYIQTEGFAAGELKHGTIALIEEKTPVIALISDQKINLNTRSNLNEVVARGAETIIIAFKSVSLPNDDVILEDVHPLLAAMLMVVPTQLIAYYAALLRENDIDKPRNLAKSVTVE